MKTSFTISVLIVICSYLSAFAQTAPMVQNHDIGLIDRTDGNIIVGDGDNFVGESGATARTSLGFIDPILDAGSPPIIGNDTPNNASFTYLDWDLAPVTTPSEGRMYWNNEDGTLNLGMPGSGDVNLQIGQEILIRARATEDILNGEVVYISGGSGSRPTVTKAIANDESIAHRVIGVATEDISSGNNGYVTALGFVRGINTSAFNDGDRVFLSASVAGGLTTTEPTAPNYSVTIGYITNANASGDLFVSIHHDIWETKLLSTGLATEIPFMNATANGFDYSSNLTYSGSGLTLGNHFLPLSDDSHDLGSTTSEWRNLFVDGTAEIDYINNRYSVSSETFRPYSVNADLDFRLRSNSYGMVVKEATASNEIFRLDGSGTLHLPNDSQAMTFGDGDDVSMNYTGSFFDVDIAGHLDLYASTFMNFTCYSDMNFDLRGDFKVRDAAAGDALRFNVNLSDASTGIGGGSVADYPLTIYQTADTKGLRLYGFDDQSSNYADIFLDAAGAVYYNSSKSMYMYANNGSVVMRATGSIFYDSSGTIGWRDRDDSYATELELDTADGTLSMPNDNQSFTQGAGDDFSMYFDGTDQQFESAGNFRFDSPIILGNYVFHTSQNTGIYYGGTGRGRIYADTLPAGGAAPWVIKSGNGTTYTDGSVTIDIDGVNRLNLNNSDINVHSNGDVNVECDNNGTLVLTNPVYEDVRVGISNVRVPAANAPTWTAYKGGQVLAFSPTADQIIYFEVQLPHGYVEGEDIEAHIHDVYPDANAGNVNWNFTYSVAAIGSTFPAETTVDTTLAASGVADQHTLQDISDPIDGTNMGISTCILCSLEREGTDAINDTYANSVYLVSIDFHVPINTLGSRTETAK